MDNDCLDNSMIQPSMDGLSNQESDSIEIKAFEFKTIHLGLMAIFLTFFLMANLSFIREVSFAVLTTMGKTYKISQAELTKKTKALQQNIKSLHKRNDQFIPKKPYLIINSTGNQFFLLRDGQVLRQGVCSTGSNVLLKTRDNRQWLFRTPRGIFQIQNKIVSPIWKMPDWAFVEEGKPVPPPNASERFEYGALGEYALSLGDGYLIHGTLYQRLLGMPVTHGCIRIGDDDLEFIFRHLDIGAKVFIY